MKITQTAIANFIGLSRQAVCDMKKGRRALSKKTAIRVSRITGIGIHELFFMDYETLRAALVRAMDNPAKRGRDAEEGREAGD